MARQIAYKISKHVPTSLTSGIRHGRGIASWARRDPTLFARTVAKKAGRALHVRSQNPTAVHIGYHNPGNAGDTVLFRATRELWDRTIWPAEWVKLEVSAPVDDSNFSDLSASDAIVVGGGGLFLRDTNANQVSGWQWAIPSESLERLQTPLVVWAVGYNRFRGQPDFDEVFKSNVKTLVGKAIFTGLRNRGSIEAISRYLEPELRSRLSFQPCPTVHLARLYGMPESALAEGKPNIAFNAAFDRRLLRFGTPQEENRIMTQIARALRELASRGWKVSVVLHLPTDAAAIPWLQLESVPYEVVDLWAQNADVVTRFYSQQALTLGMRGHSQMIPFGLGNGIVSIGSHDKLAWFLEDIRHPEWGVDVSDQNLAEHLIDLVDSLTLSTTDTRSKLIHAEECLWTTTIANASLVRSRLEELRG